jgi:hypothetical protein
MVIYPCMTRVSVDVIAMKRLDKIMTIKPGHHGNDETMIVSSARQAGKQPHLLLNDDAFTYLSRRYARWYVSNQARASAPVATIWTKHGSFSSGHMDARIIRIVTWSIALLFSVVT